MPSLSTALYLTDPRQALTRHNRRSVVRLRPVVRVENVAYVVPASRFATLFLFGLAAWLPVVTGFVLSAKFA